MTRLVMESLDNADPRVLRGIEYVLTDVDDTLTSRGRLRGETLDALDRLRRAGIRITPVTAASAGWCNLMIHMWPIEAVIAENGGLYFLRGPDGKVTRRRWAAETNLRPQLDDLADRLIAAFPQLVTADDQPYRETSVAFLRGDSEMDRAVIAVAHGLGASATLNSLWIICWLGEYDKLAMAQRLFSEAYGLGLEQLRDHVFYVGDSENDEPMFRFFPYSAGVATVVDRPLRYWPRWLCRGAGGEGFVEVADKILVSRTQAPN